MLAAPVPASNLVHEADDESARPASSPCRLDVSPENVEAAEVEGSRRKSNPEVAKASASPSASEQQRKTSVGSKNTLIPDPPSDDEDSGDGAQECKASEDQDTESGTARVPSGFHQGPSADWSASAKPAAHVFIPTSSSGDACYLGNECRQSGNRLKCVACRIICHESCVADVSSKLLCRETFRDDVRKYREQASVEHHWVQRRNLKGKCKKCGKAFQSMLGFGSSKEIVGTSCSWCKSAYHNKESCQKDMDDTCELGSHANIIVPPSWIIKVPRKGSFKSSLKTSPNKRRQQQMARQESKDQGERSSVTAKPFCIKPIPSKISPVLVFLNPKSGGNQGAKLMQKFQWLLNPRQVFDLTQGGPQPAIEMFKKTPNLKLLACGGDGTVGWLLSVLDKVKVEPPPSVSVLPLGTGNDLSRSLGWGGGYIDEPISKILNGLQNAEEVKMDRWILDVTRNEEYPSTEKGHDKLPLNVVNNYFSFGVDAQIALQFHEAREANPQKFNSRIRNKMFYGQAGGKDLLLRKWKDLSDEITVICDGVDITPKLKEHRVHSVLFANIPSFGSGTRPWDPSKGDQRIDDGKIEVIGLTTYQLPMLQAGSHGYCITQCTSAQIKTRKTIPMQVDGEAIRLNPANIELKFLNQVRMLAKRKKDQPKISYQEKVDPIELQVKVLKMLDYVSEVHYDKELLNEKAKPVGTITVKNNNDLEEVRDMINKIMEEAHYSSDWTYIDSVTAGRCFRVDKEQETLHYITDITDESGLYLLLDEDNEPQSEVDGSTAKNAASSPTRLKANDDDDLLHEEEAKDSFLAVGNTVENNNTSPAKPTNNNNLEAGKATPSPSVHQVLEKTTEGILKAARLGDLNMLRDLHNAGYSLMSIDETGKTALHYGARFGHKEIIKFLISNAPGSILDIVDNEKGQTALHKAAGYKRRTICCMLVAAGASLLIEDQAGLLPRQLALMAEDSDLAAYLESQEQFQREKAEGGAGLAGDFETPV